MPLGQMKIPQSCPTLDSDTLQERPEKLNHDSREASAVDGKSSDPHCANARESAFLCDQEEGQEGIPLGADRGILAPGTEVLVKHSVKSSADPDPSCPLHAPMASTTLESNASSKLSDCKRRRGSIPVTAAAAAAGDVLTDATEGTDLPSSSDSPPLRDFAADVAQAANSSRLRAAAAAAAVAAATEATAAAVGGGMLAGDGSEYDKPTGRLGSGGVCDGRASGRFAASAFSPNSLNATTPITGLIGLDTDSRGWVDTMTMWNSVQRHGEEMQRRKAAGPAHSCVGASWHIEWPRRLLQRARTQLIVAARVAAKDPYTVIVPLLLLICMLAFGLWGVFSVSYAIRDGRRQAAYNAAVDFGNTLKSHIAATVAPASTVQTLIQLTPSWPVINKTFYEVAPDLVVKGRQYDAILTIVMAPQGIASAIVPSGLPAWQKVIGLDLLREPAWRNDALKTVALAERGMVMTGPSRLRAGMMGIVTRYPVFIPGASPDDTFGFNGSAYNCSPCYVPGNATTPGKRFWGFAQLNVDWEVLIRNVTHMYDLCDRDGLHFNMTYIDPVNGTNRSIASCGHMDTAPVFVNITTMQNWWVLAVSDSRGWEPDWMPLVLAVVVIVSLWISITMAIILINRREHMWLLQAMLPKKVIATLRRGEEYAEAFECVTVLFSDIVSYTTMASEMEPIKVVRLLNTMYSAFDALVDQFDCYKVETIGDAFMAVCGTQGEDAIVAAAKMARLAQAMVERTRVLVSADGQKIQIRIGLHSGPVVGAVVGFKMPHFCLCGDTVNTASRMESNSKPMRIHISDVTAQLLLASKESFRLERRGPIEVKGKGTMITHWLLPPPDVAAATCGGGGGGGGGSTASDCAAVPPGPSSPSRPPFARSPSSPGGPDGDGLGCGDRPTSPRRLSLACGTVPEIGLMGSTHVSKRGSLSLDYARSADAVIASIPGADSGLLSESPGHAASGNLPPPPPPPAAARSGAGSLSIHRANGLLAGGRSGSRQASSTRSHSLAGIALPLTMSLPFGSRRRTSEMLGGGGGAAADVSNGSGRIGINTGGFTFSSHSQQRAQNYHLSHAHARDSYASGNGVSGGGGVMAESGGSGLMAAYLSGSGGNTRRTKPSSVDLRLFQLTHHTPRASKG